VGRNIGGRRGKSKHSNLRKKVKTYRHIDSDHHARGRKVESQKVATGEREVSADDRRVKINKLAGDKSLPARKRKSGQGLHYGRNFK